MRILHICAYTWEIGGPARTIYDHTAEALKSGHQVDILSPITAGDKLYPVPNGARVISCKRTPVISRLYREFSWELLYFLHRHIHEYDVIHIHGIWHFGSLAPFLVKNSVPKVITIHGLLDRWAVQQSRWKKQLVTALFQKKILTVCDRIHVLNKSEEEDVARYLGYRPANVIRIPNGIPIADYTSLPPKGAFRKQFNLPDNKKLVLFMSRLHIKKGLDLLLPAFEQYNRQYKDAVLVLAGPDDGYQETAERFIRDHQLSESIIVVGMLTGLSKKNALSDADLFVLPTYSEGLSIAVLENMAAGVPALVSDKTGLDEETKRYEAAVITDLTVSDVKENLEMLLQDENYRKRIAKNAFKMVCENFDIHVVANQMLKEYQKIQIG